MVKPFLVVGLPGFDNYGMNGCLICLHCQAGYLLLMIFIVFLKVSMLAAQVFLDKKGSNAELFARP